MSDPRFQIVLAEDSPADVMLVRVALKDAGLNCDLTVLEDGESAIGLIEQLDADPKTPLIDLLLLDMHLSKCDGEAVLKRLRSTERNAQAPVIVMSASEAPEDYATAQKYAAIHYFRKPTSLAEFIQLGVIVRGILAGKTTAAGQIAEAEARGGKA